MKYKLLYIDDEEDNLIVFSSAFRRDFDVMTCTSGAEALALLENNRFDLVVSDQRMPNMTGAQVFARINQQDPDAVKILLTGYSDTAALIDAVNEGKIYHYCTKPWTKDQLKGIFDKAIAVQNARGWCRFAPR